MLVWENMKQIVSALIETNHKGQLDSEMQDVLDELTSRDIPIDLFSHKQVQRRQLDLKPDILVVGYVDSMLSVFKQLNIPVPDTNDYPKALNHLLYRDIWVSNINTLRQDIYAGKVPLFAKPKDRKKRFTGKVFNSIDDFMWELSGVSTQTAIYCSEVKTWITEYRVYVVNKEIVGIHHYFGDPEVSLDEITMQSAISLLNDTDETTAGYALDMGVLSSGETAVVEWNDGFSLGSYGLDKALYTDLLLARWSELVMQIPQDHES
jgi:hypothetical protein